MAEGSLRASAPGEASASRVVSAVLAFNSAGGVVSIDDLAIGDVVENCWADVTVVFNAGTTNVVVLGDGTTANKYLASGDVTEGSTGVTPAGGKGPYAAETAAGTLKATYTQTGTAATTGSCRVYARILNIPE